MPKSVITKTQSARLRQNYKQYCVWKKRGEKGSVALRFQYKLLEEKANEEKNDNQKEAKILS